jgi:hypothetical protein
VFVVKTGKRRTNRASSPHRIENSLLARDKCPSLTDIIEHARKILVDAAEDWFASQEPGPIRYRGHLLEATESSDDWIGLTKRATSGDPDADAVLCGKAALMIENGEKIQGPLAEYISSKLYDRFFVQKSRRTAYAGRDMFILSFVSTLQKNDIRPTRNDASRDKAGRDSGCSLVTEVLNKFGFDIDERGVEEVWRKRRRNSELKLDC